MDVHSNIESEDAATYIQDPQCRNKEITGIIEYPFDEPAGETSEGFTNADGFVDDDITEIFKGTVSDSDSEVEYSESSTAKLVAALRFDVCSSDVAADSGGINDELSIRIDEEFANA